MPLLHVGGNGTRGRERLFVVVNFLEASSAISIFCLVFSFFPSIPLVVNCWLPLIVCISPLGVPS